MTCPGLPLQLLWRTLTDERWDLCEVCASLWRHRSHGDVTWAWTPRWPVATSSVVKISSFVAQSMAMGVQCPLGVPMARRFVVGIRQALPMTCEHPAPW